MTKTKNETVLTVDELERMGDMIADIIETIELYNHALNLVPDGRNTDPNTLAVHYQSVHDLTRTMFYKNQKIMKDLDDISYTLLESDHAFEIENTRKHFSTHKTEDLNDIILDEKFSF